MISDSLKMDMTKWYHSLTPAKSVMTEYHAELSAIWNKVPCQFNGCHLLNLWEAPLEYTGAAFYNVLPGEVLV